MTLGVPVQDPILMFAISLRQADHVKRFSIAPARTSGWEVRREEDARVQRLNHYDDWHRVERVRALFEREVMELREAGWEAS